MLILSRRDGERFVCEELGLLVTVLESHNGRTKLGIDAPQELRFHREEVLSKLRLMDEEFAELAQPAA